MAWRIPSILQAVPSVIQVGLIWFVPESPRWCVQLLPQLHTHPPARIAAAVRTKLMWVVVLTCCPSAASARLVSKGKVEQARAVLARYHTEDSDQDHPLVNYEMAEIERAIEIDANNSTTWISLLQTKGNRKRLRIICAIAFFSQWSGNGLVSYYRTSAVLPVCGRSRC